MKKVIELIFPMYYNHISNDKVKKKIDETQKEYDNNDKLIEKIEMETYKERYLDTIKIKDKLEEKAKTNVIGITIAVSLIIGASGILDTVYNRFYAPSIKWFAFIIFVVAVLYMITAGILGIMVLINDNVLFCVNLETFAKSKKSLSAEYKGCIKLNTLQNTIRNNSVFTSYECIRNSLICLFLIMIIVCVPIKHEINSYDDSSINGRYELFYSTKAMDFLKLNDVQDMVEEKIINDVTEDNRTNTRDIINITDYDSNIIIKYNCIDWNVHVFLIEPISNV